MMILKNAMNLCALSSMDNFLSQFYEKDTDYFFVSRSGRRSGSATFLYLRDNKNPLLNLTIILNITSIRNKFIREVSYDDS